MLLLVLELTLLAPFITPSLPLTSLPPLSVVVAAAAAVAAAAVVVVFIVVVCVFVAVAAASDSTAEPYQSSLAQNQDMVAHAHPGTDTAMSETSRG